MTAGDTTRAMAGTEARAKHADPIMNSTEVHHAMPRWWVTRWPPTAWLTSRCPMFAPRDPSAARAVAFSGGRDRRRSGDLALFRRALCQLSYPTVSGPDGI